MINVNNIQNLDGSIRIKTNELVTFENGVLKSNNTDLVFSDSSLELLRIDGDTKLTYFKNELIDTFGSVESKTIVYEDNDSNPFIKIIPKIFLIDNINNPLIRLTILKNSSDIDNANGGYNEYLPSFIDGNTVYYNPIEINTNRIEFKILSDMNLIYSVSFDLFTYY